MKLKNGFHTYKYALCIVLTYSSAVFAQLNPALLEGFNTGHTYGSMGGIKKFYAGMNYKTAWIQRENTGNRNYLLNLLSSSFTKALREKDYQYAFIDSFRNGMARLQNANDSIEAELRFTDAAIHFFSDIAGGNSTPGLGYNGLNYSGNCYDIPAMLSDAVSGNKLQLLATAISPVLPEVAVMEKKINRYLQAMADTGFREVIISSGTVTTANTNLVTKLYQLGILDSVYTALNDTLLIKKLKEAQLAFELPADGKLRGAILQQLNIPLYVRLQQLDLSVNYYRWLNCLTKDQPVIVVNIPAAYLKVYQREKVILEMRIVDGKRSTPTPTLLSRVNDVVLYPYWHVPSKIAIKELLPAFRRKPAAFNTGNYQLVNRSGQVVDPASVNWNTLGAGNFPYILRQSTGCDNALGLLKLNFYNPFDVYLHDTPSKRYFKMNRRYFSHGCMRMEKPMDLGHLVLKNNSIAIDTLEQKGCLRNRAPISVRASVPMPVLVWYNPAGIDAEGRVLFYDDVYGKFNWLRK